jgi:hypothetical protein
VRRRQQLRLEVGQILVVVAIALPLFFSVCAFVIDGTNLMVHRRAIQNAADAASLAASQDLSAPVYQNMTPNPDCTGWAGEKTARQALVDRIEEYSSKNGGPATLDGGSCSFDSTRCNAPSDKNCYTWPYGTGPNAKGLVEVRLSEGVSGFFANVAHLSSLFHVSARAVSSTSPVLGTTTIPGSTDPGSTDPNVTITGPVHTTTDPDTNLGGNGVGFAMSRICGNLGSGVPGAIDYSGAGTDIDPTDNAYFVLGAFTTNGGMTMSGNKPKKVTALFYDATRCAKPSADSGTANCTGKKWGDASDSTNNYCAKTLVDLGQNLTLPINWPLTPPTLPTIKTGANASTYDPATDYPSKCVGLGNSGTISITGNGWASSHVPGVYCVSGAGTVLKFGGGSAGADVSGGYTFFALGGATILTAGRATVANFYFPSSGCSISRPTTARPTSFTCFGQTISGDCRSAGYCYDPQTLLYATSQLSDRGTCGGSGTNNAICLNGSDGNLTGDIFAPKPDVFPPSTTQTGATVFIAGGALSAGKGFIESWQLTIQGNTGSYTGNGVPIVIPGATHTTTDPNITITGTTRAGTTDPGLTNTFTTGTTIGLDE